MGASNPKPTRVTITENDTSFDNHEFSDKYILTPVEIGRGANAVVMMATCKTNDKVVVVKKIKKEASERNRQLIKKECEISMSLKHPHILEFYDYYENENDTYLVCEYCQGGELYDLIKDTKIRTGRGITEEKARAYLSQIISAVEYLHCNLIAHRDLKPENILLDKEKKNIKICDFGMAAVLSGENYANRRYSSCGSPGYFAPEIIQDFYQPLISEVWSLGVVLYSMVAGEMPFGSGEDYIAKMREDNSAYMCPVYFSSDLKNLLRQMLVFNPKIRISLAKVKEHPWMLGCAIPQKKYPALKIIETWKLRYMVHLGYSPEEVYKAVIENKRDSMFVSMYHNLKPAHVPEQIRHAFGMINSSVGIDDERNLRKLEKKSKSDPSYKQTGGHSRGSPVSENSMHENAAKVEKTGNKANAKITQHIDVPEPNMKAAVSLNNSPANSPINSYIVTPLDSQKSSPVSLKVPSPLNTKIPSPTNTKLPSPTNTKISPLSTSKKSPLLREMTGDDRKKDSPIHSNANSPKLGKRFEAITRRASDIFKGKKTAAKKEEPINMGEINVEANIVKNNNVVEKTNIVAKNEMKNEMKSELKNEMKNEMKSDPKNEFGSQTSIEAVQGVYASYLNLMSGRANSPKMSNSSSGSNNSSNSQPKNNRPSSWDPDRSSFSSLLK